jgi:hypothetical protein
MMPKMPGTPIAASSTGAMTSATMNEAPMLMPITAMARVRTSVRVRSASSALTDADTAPAPWTPRATASTTRLCANMPSTEPAAKNSKPSVIKGLRP